MLNISEIKIGKKIVWEEIPYNVIYHEHSKTGRAGAVLRTKLQNLLNGSVLEKTFQGSEKVYEADIAKSQAQYLYKEGSEFFFMDSVSYDQFSLSQEVLGSATNYLKEGTNVTVLNYNGNPINVEIPVKVTLRVVEAPPGIKGNTASAGDKLVTLETGMKVTTPLFVDEGDEIIVNTERGEYVSRA